MTAKAKRYAGKIKTETPQQMRTISGDILICKLSAGENNGVKNKTTLRILNNSA